VLNSRPLRELLEGIVRCLPKDQKQAKAITADILKRVVDAARAEGDSPIMRRDVAMLLLGFAAGLRRVELTYLGREDFSIAGNQASVRLVRSKASQTKPVLVWVGMASEGLYCPLQAVQDWRAVAPKGSAYLFSGTTTRLGKMRVSYQSWAAIITRRLEAAGIDPDGFSSHSLRAGLVTSLNCAGLVTAVVSAQTRHQSQDMISRYHRPGGSMALNFTVEAGL
jgi:integrase